MAYELTLVIPAGPHDGAALQNLLASIRRQAFPKERLEILVITEGNSEEARNQGIQEAQGEIIGCLDTDNQLYGHEFLSALVAAARDPKVCGAYPAYYAYFREDPSLERYFALLGANDPLAWWLGKADRLPHHVQQGVPCTKAFNRQVPTLGSNGFFVKRACIQPFAHGGQGHIDTCELMRQAGHYTYTVTSHVIGHRTAPKGLGAYLRKRAGYVRTLYWQQRGVRRWRMVHNTRDVLWTGAFAVSSVLGAPHLCYGLLHGLLAYRRNQDWCWLWHPIVCYAFTLLYGYLSLEHLWRITIERWWRHGIAFFVPGHS